jgi:hypothetical protein
VIANETTDQHTGRLIQQDPRLIERLATELGVAPDDLLATLDEWILTVPSWDI